MIKFYFEDEAEITDIYAMNYCEFLQHEMVLYIDTGQSKKQLSHFKKKIEQKSFYPIHIIRINSYDTDKSRQNKLKQSQQKNEDKFKERYRQVAKKQFDTESLFEIRDKIKKCPFCHKSKLKIIHDYSIDNSSNCSLFLKCNSCSQILDSQSIICIMDAYYMYNATVEIYMDEYCQNFDDKSLQKKIYNELENTEIIGLMPCQ